MIRVESKQVITFNQHMIDQVDVGDLVFKILHNKPINNLVNEDSHNLDTIEDLSTYSNYMPTIKIYDNDRLLWDNLNGYAKL
jgi:hypothetical protein